MNGRLEHEIRINNTINTILSSCPIEVNRFYRKIRTTKEPTTCLEYIRKINSFLLYVNKGVKQITASDIDDYFSNILYIVDDNGVTRRSSSSYRQSIYSALNQFFTYLYTRNEIKNNPMTFIERPKNTDHVDRISLEIEELNSILDCVKKGVGSNAAKLKQKDWMERDYLIMFLFMNTGMRKTALSEINIQDISFDNKILTVVDKRNKTLQYIITPELETTIKKWLIKRELLLNGINEDALFISDKKKRISEKAVYYIVKKYSKAALGYPISPHKLRASFVTIFYKASGYDIKATCEAVGHSNIATTSLYVVNRNNARKDAATFMSSNLIV